MKELTRYLLVPALVGALVGLLVIVFADNEPAPAAPTGFADAVARTAPAVVNIYSTKVASPPICQLPRYREWCEAFRGNSSARMQSSLGSGVVLRPDGYIITNNHVIQGADEILVAFNNGQATTATLVGRDEETDLAVIKVNAEGLATIEPGSSDSTRVGDIALAIGNPFGIGQTVSQGIISAKGRAGISASPYDDFIQTDAAINPGNSGGALINAEGELIGINTMIFSQTGGSDGIGFAIPSQLVLSVLDEIVATGRVTRGWLGIELATAPAPGTGVGLAVTRVLPEGPAANAGVRPGDLVVAVNNTPASSSVAASREIAGTPPGGEVRLTVVRNASTLELNVLAGERPSS